MLFRNLPLFSENPYENLKNLQEPEDFKRLVYSTKKINKVKDVKEFIDFEKLDVKEFTEAQIQKAQNSTIKELRNEIEKDIKILMSEEHVADAKFEILLCIFCFVLHCYYMGYYIFSSDSNVNINYKFLSVCLLFLQKMKKIFSR